MWYVVCGLRSVRWFRSVSPQNGNDTNISTACPCFSVFRRGTVLTRCQSFMATSTSSHMMMMMMTIDWCFTVTFAKSKMKHPKDMPRRDSNTGGSDLFSSALPVRPRMCRRVFSYWRIQSNRVKYVQIYFQFWKNLTDY